MLDNDKITENGVTVVKFYAEWCMPCKSVSKIMKGISDEYSDVTFSEIDVDDNPGLAKKYKIKSLPTVVCINDNKEISRISGIFNINELKKIIDDILADKAA